MKKKIFTSLFAVLMLLAIGLLGNSCGSDDYLSDYEIQQMIDNSLNGQWKIVPIESKIADWTWNETDKQYVAVYELPELTSNIYEEGAILGYIYIGQQGVDEVQKPLPYNFTYPKDTPPGAYLEIISYDVQYKDNGQSTVAFYIQTSDLTRMDNYLANYTFRIVLIW